MALQHCPPLAEQEKRRKRAPKDLRPLECLVVCVDDCTDTRGVVAVPLLFAQT